MSVNFDELRSMFVGVYFFETRCIYEIYTQCDGCSDIICLSTISPMLITYGEIKRSYAWCRCKLFCKAGDSWKDRGTGYLFLKPCGDRTQLLIRADTATGQSTLLAMLHIFLGRYYCEPIWSNAVINCPLYI